MLQTAEASRRPVIWNSLVHRWDQPDLYRRLMAFMEEANETGRRIYAMGRTQRMDLEFNFRFTAMFDLFPAWREAVWAPDDEKRRLFRDPGTRARLREEWDTRVSRMSSRRPELLEVTRASTEGRPPPGGPAAHGTWLPTVVSISLTSCWTWLWKRTWTSSSPTLVL